MKISQNDWNNYIKKLSNINVTAGTEMQKYINSHGMDDVDALIDHAYAIVNKYGEASGALACQMYDDIAELSGKAVEAAEMAPISSYDETAKAIHGTMLNLNNSIPNTVSRLVKQVAADTTLRNGLRDGAKFAWIPSGDTCAFCITLASRGWQYVSKNAIKNGHAEHIHANCNCEYAISFDKNPQVDGYDPNYYLDMYKSADGSSPKQKINAIRRMQYADVRGRGKSLQTAWEGDKLKKSLGADYSEFKELVEKSPNNGLYNKYSEEAIYKKDRKGYYSRFSSEVHYGMSEKEGQSKFATLSHEVGHMIDDKMGRVPGLNYGEIDLINEKCIIGSGIVKTITPLPSNSDEFLKALRQDMENLKPKVMDKSIKTELLETMAKRNATSGIQDALDGFYATQDSGLLPWGHGNRYYNREYNRKIASFNNEKNLKDVYSEMGFDASSITKVKKLCRVYEASSEAWANVSSAFTCGGDSLKYMQEYMPETCKAYLRIVGE